MQPIAALAVCSLGKLKVALLHGRSPNEILSTGSILGSEKLKL
jgi:hypothetical protein